MSHNITVEGGKSIRLKTSGKYCDRDIVVTSTGGREDLDAVLTEQESLIAQLKQLLLAEDKLPYKRELAYLESTGTQWIDTGVTINTATDTIELIFENKETELYKWLFGEYDTSARIGLGSGDGTNKRNVIYGTTVYKATDAMQYSKKHTFEVNSQGVFIDNAKTHNFASFAAKSSIYLFNLNIESTSSYICKSKIWSYKHTRNGILIRDFIPVIDMDDNEMRYIRNKASDTVRKSRGMLSFEKALEDERALSTGE